VEEPRWISRRIAFAIHTELLQEHGGLNGMREGGEALLESALARPRQRFAYAPETDLPDLGAAYLHGLAKNHPFLDGNKRVAFAVAATFLLWNGRRLTAAETEAWRIVIGVSENRVAEVQLRDWMRENSVPVKPA
jgi:death on curing protein